MKLLKCKNENEEFLVKDSVIGTSRRMYESGIYSKEFIIDITGLTEIGYEEVIKRTAVMDCARKLVSHYAIEFFQKNLKLNEEEMKDLIKYKDNKTKEFAEVSENETAKKHK